MSGRGWSVALTSTLLLLTACQPEASPLPFYRDGDLTPEWISPSAKGYGDIHRIGDFQLTDQTGASVTAADLAGHIVVASFFYIQCGELCPTIQAQIARVREAYRDAGDVLMVSHSVHPDEDTPEALRDYGERMHIDPGGWALLTGDTEDIHRLAKESYFIDLEEGRYHGVAKLAHTENVVLLDPELRIRGVYNGTLAFEMNELIKDIAVLRSELGVESPSLANPSPTASAAPLKPEVRSSNHLQGRSS